MEDETVAVTQFDASATNSLSLDNLYDSDMEVTATNVSEGEWLENSTNLSDHTASQTDEHDESYAATNPGNDSSKPDSNRPDDDDFEILMKNYRLKSHDVNRMDKKVYEADSDFTVSGTKIENLELEPVEPKDTTQHVIRTEDNTGDGESSDMLSENESQDETPENGLNGDDENCQDADYDPGEGMTSRMLESTGNVVQQNMTDSDTDVDSIMDDVTEPGSTTGMNQLTYECFSCGKMFKKFSSLEKHERTLNCSLTANNRYKCSLCKKTYASKTGLIVHIRKHGDEKPFSCNLCEYSTKTASSLKSHIRCKHTHEKPFACKTCGERFDMPAKLAKHNKNHAALKYVCKTCNIKLSSKHDIKQHKRMHPDDTDDGKSERMDSTKVIQCPICKKRFSREDYLEIHIGAIHENNRRFKCKMCSDTFSHRNCLTIHIRQHTGETPFKCSVCGKTFKQSVHLKTHLNSHKSQEDRSYKCSQCPKGFCTKGQMKRHESTHAGKNEPCEICGKLFYHLLDVKRHMKIHTRTEKDRSHHCEICSKSFFSAAELKLHEDIHTGFKPIGCSFCDKRFRCITKAKDHERTHTGERPNQCPICDQNFRSRKALQVHSETHTDASLPDANQQDANVSKANLNSCRTCGKTFITTSGLSSHKKVHYKRAILS